MADRTRRRRTLCGLALTAALVSGQFASAHDGLAERLAVVTAQLARNDGSADLLVKRADLYREGGRWDEALADLARAERIAPALSIVDLVRAHVFLDAHNWIAAVDAATRFLARQPGNEPPNADALIVRGRARARAGRARLAAADFTRVLERQPLPDIYIERARALTTLGPPALDDAVRGLDDGIARLGPIVTLELEAVDLDVRLRRFDSALARLDRVAAQASRKDTWLARRGAILERAGRLDEARATYGAALNSAGSQPERIRQTRASVALIDRLRVDIHRLQH